MFKDKVYEEMDEISKLIEPYQYSINEEMSKFPDEIEVKIELLDTLWGVSVRDILRHEALLLDLKELANKSYDIANEFFEFKIVNDENEEVESTRLNFRDGVLLDRVLMIKKKIGYEDNDLEKIVKNSFASSFDVYTNYSSYSASRINEIADLFNAYEAMKERSVRRKFSKLRTHFSNLFDSKKLDIRDVGLASRLGKWLVLYAKDGNLAALNNITRLKIMTHQNKPIYSMEEKETK